MDSPFLAVARSVWTCYFPETHENDEQVHIEDDPRFQVACTLLHCFQDPEQWESLVDQYIPIESDLFCIRLCYQQLINRCQLPNFPSYLQQHFEEYIACMGLALCMLRYEHACPQARKIIVRLRNVSPILSIAHIKSNVLNQLVCITGTVVRVGAIQPLVTRCEFLCAQCGISVPGYFPHGRYTPPISCTSCRSRYLCINRSTAETIDFQRIKLQEMEDSQSAPGRMPRMIEIELYEDLVDSCIPGNTVSVCGLVQRANEHESAQKSALHVLNISANNIESFSNFENPTESKVLSDSSLLQLRQRAKQGLLFDHMVHSFCPGIFGNERVKAGLLLALLGSSNHARCTRINSHVLLLGDPGLGKSQLLRAASALSNRSVYVSGRTATSTGLTVTMAKDSAGDYALEAGALVMADQGVCCIDELDKSKGEIEAVLEAMEQQCISIAKAGMVCTMNARTSVFAAANPRRGHFEKEKTIGQNLDMKAALLSRFDLIFVLIDSPDEGRDRLLTNHVLKMHAVEKGIGMPSNTKNKIVGEGSGDLHVLERLIRNAPMCGKKMSVQKLKQLITYTRRHVHPRLSEPAARLLQKEYLRLRSCNAMLDEEIPITTRQLESLVRLAHARARADMSDIVTEQHAKDVVEIMRSCLKQNSGITVPLRSKKPVSQWSLPKKVQLYVEHLAKHAQSEDKSMYTYTELVELEVKLGLQIINFHEFIDKLRDHCYLLKKGRHLYQFQRSNIR